MEMTKELLTIEFRYYDKPKNDRNSEYRNKTITLGVFDTLEKAIDEGNKALNILSKNFKVGANDKFKINDKFGSPKRLVTNTLYPTNGIQYFAKIIPLNFNDLTETINETFNAFERYKKFKQKIETLEEAIENGLEISAVYVPNGETVILLNSETFIGGALPIIQYQDGTKNVVELNDLIDYAWN